MGLFGDILGGLGDVAPIVSGALGLLGSDDTNSAAAANTQAGEQWAEQMRGTAYQATTADMKAAGLNPMLAYSQGPTSIGSAPSAPVTNAIGNAVSASQAQQQISLQAQNTQAQTNQANTQAALNIANAKVANASAAIKGPEATAAGVVNNAATSAVANYKSLGGYLSGSIPWPKVGNASLPWND